MNKMTGTLVITETQSRDFCTSKPYDFYDKDRDCYITITHEGGDVIGISKEILEDAHEWALIPLNDKDYQWGRYHLACIGWEYDDCRTMLFSLSSTDADE